MLKLLVCRGYSSRRRRVVSVVAIGLAFVGVYFSLSHFPMNKDRATVDGVRLNVNFQRGILNAGRETVHERSSAEGWWLQCVCFVLNCLKPRCES